MTQKHPITLIENENAKLLSFSLCEDYVCENHLLIDAQSKSDSYLSTRSLHISYQCSTIIISRIKMSNPNNLPDSWSNEVASNPWNRGNPSGGQSQPAVYNQPQNNFNSNNGWGSSSPSSQPINPWSSPAAPQSNPWSSNQQPARPYFGNSSANNPWSAPPSNSYGFGNQNWYGGMP